MTEQQFPAMLFLILYKVILNFESMDEVKPSSVNIQMKATEQYFPAVSFIMMYKVVLTFESVEKILHVK